MSCLLLDQEEVVVVIGAVASSVAFGTLLMGYCVLGAAALASPMVPLMVVPFAPLVGQLQWLQSKCVP
jgi:hypothetical protein